MPKENRYKLKDSVREAYLPAVQNFINKLENIEDESTELLIEDFSDCKLNPHTMQKLLESLGYEETGQEENGWQLDFWITMKKEGFRDIQISGCGMTFELKLSEVEE